MASELLAGLGIFKALYDSAKALKDVNDGTVRNAAVIELQEKILSAHAAQFALLERISELEKEMANIEKWDAEKQEYELKEIVPGSLAYALKAQAQASKPAHCICAACYQHRKKSFLQRKPESDASRGLGKPPLLFCAECKTEIIAG